MKDILICTLIIALIYLAENFFPYSLLLEILILTIAAIYYGGKLWEFCKKYFHSKK